MKGKFFRVLIFTECVSKVNQNSAEKRTEPEPKVAGHGGSGLNYGSDLCVKGSGELVIEGAGIWVW